MPKQPNGTPGKKPRGGREAQRTDHALGLSVLAVNRRRLKSPGETPPPVHGSVLLVSMHSTEAVMARLTPERRLALELLAGSRHGAAMS